jgi:lipopolysaccharide biosynthesis glycosyltransferase
MGPPFTEPVAAPTSRSVTEPVTVLFASDDTFARPLAVALRSAVKVTPPPLRFVVLDCGLTDVGRALIAGAALGHEVHWVRVEEEQLAGLWQNHLPPANWARALVGEVVAADWRRVLYIDADVFVTTDLTPLFTTDLRGFPVGAVADLYVGPIGGPVGTRGVPTWHERGIVPGVSVFNSGVLLIDVDLWRARCLGERLLEEGRAQADQSTWDSQAYFTALLWDQWLPLDPRWNGKTPDAHIFHFYGPNKPWAPGYPATPIKRQYNAVATELGWQLPQSNHLAARTLGRALMRQLTPPAVHPGATGQVRRAVDRIRRPRS